MTFLPEQRLLTNISLEFVTDGVARELNETFTITFTGVEPRDLEFGATIIPEFTGAIVDVDGRSTCVQEQETIKATVVSGLMGWVAELLGAMSV